MSSSIWARAARTCFIRPRIGSGPLLGRSYVLLAARPSTNAILRPVSLLARFQSSAATLLSTEPKIAASLPVEDEAPVLPSFMSLQDVLDKRLMKALTQEPFNLTTMSPVQAEVLPLLPEIAEPYNPNQESAFPRDLLVRAKTGTGKTLAFLIPAVEARLKDIEAEVTKATQDTGLPPSKSFLASARRRYASQNTGIVIISPTRELATQIAKEAIKLTKNLEGFEVQLFVGGESKGNQLRNFRRGTHDIIVATPGRLRDILQTSDEVVKSVAHTKTYILDEADTLLDMGFQPDLLAIQEFMPKSPARQTLLFSATVSPAIRDIARASLAKHHRYINCVSNDASPVHAHIPQYHTVLPSAEHQIPHIIRTIAHDQLTNAGKSKIIVFLPTTKMTQLFADLMREVSRDTLPAGRNTNVYEIHSKRSMDSRTRASNHFRNDRSGASVLVTSDVSARGVDYPGVTRVIQVGIPSSTEQYIHRVGRTGRAGTEGRGDFILLPWERGFVTWQMTEVPLKPLTVDDLAAQTLELAKQHDEDPTAFFGGEAPVVQSTSSYLRGKPLYKSKLAPVVEDIKRTTSEILGKMDEEAINETFMSLLGYYLGKTSEMRVKKTDILEGCKSWTVEALGLERPPTVSRTFLDKMGLSNGEKMDKVRRGGFREPRRTPWVDRGEEKVRSSSYGGGERRGGDRWRTPHGGGRERSFGGSESGSERKPYERRDDAGFGGERKPYERRNDAGFSGEKRRFERRTHDDKEKPHWMTRGSRKSTRSQSAW